MAELISDGSESLAEFVLKSNASLYQTLEGFQGNQSVKRELQEELEAFNGVLEVLQQKVAVDATDVHKLHVHLFRFVNECKEFESMIMKSVHYSSRGRPSLRGWAASKYVSRDADTLQDTIVRCKSMVLITLCGANS